MDALQKPLLVLDRDLVARQANPAFYHAFSATPEETIGAGLYKLGGDKLGGDKLGEGHFDVPALREAIGCLVGQGEPFEGIELDRSFEGLGQRVLRISGQMLRGKDQDEDRDKEPEKKPEDGKGPGLLLLAMRDVTEQRRLEEKLRRQTEKLERSNEDLEQFAYAASHDLQEPLRMVSSYLQLLERRYKEDLDETAREFIEYAVDGAERMKALINGLLQYSRVGRKEGEFGEVDLKEVLEGVLSDLEREIEELSGTVTQETLPTTYGSKDQLRRLFQNLIENALTYCGEAAPEVHVSGHTEPDGAAHVIVRDEGPGIPPEGQDKIFQIFAQLDPHGAGQEGSGMGLALCKKIAERHGGDIWAESELGEGSAFHVTLDLSPSER
ncbi:PAS domain-containing sensor histidine kinase [Salinibacter altiplanensis]|uniref:PAS domain-containing sensor histidine kinase n=1 Tax=Salinibacter altiplanensis TaxID=1803181 RepID=UPI001F40B928|nr:ATP-binding protein [Salinibacter altiplanensis]